MKRIVAMAVLGLLLFSVPVGATLTTIGTAAYLGQEYNLIWDDDNNGNSIVWLDYTNAEDTWGNQMDWAAGLGGLLTYNIDAGYSVIWDDNQWRLPATLDGPTSGYTYDGSTSAGYNITSSEMGHLFYVELGNTGHFDVDGSTTGVYGIQNTGDLKTYWTAIFIGPQLSVQRMLIVLGDSNFLMVFKPLVF